MKSSFIYCETIIGENMLLFLGNTRSFNKWQDFTNDNSDYEMYCYYVENRINNIPTIDRDICFPLSNEKGVSVIDVYKSICGEILLSINNNKNDIHLCFNDGNNIFLLIDNMEILRVLEHNNNKNDISCVIQSADYTLENIDKIVIFDPVSGKSDNKKFPKILNSTHQKYAVYTVSKVENINVFGLALIPI